MPTRTRPPITALIPTGNSADVIRDCIESVRWADEILVCDSFSTDGTLEICREYGCRIIQHPYINSATQKNWAIPQATHPWILLIDTDERVTPALRDEIERTLRDPGDRRGFRIPRFNLAWGQPLRHGGYAPDYQLRLFGRDHARYQERQVHAHMVVDGAQGTLHNPFVHYAHRSLTQTLSNLLVRMTPWEAQARIARGERFSVWHLLLRPPAAFALRYIKQRGYRDGVRGLVMAVIWSCYVALTYLQMWEIEQQVAPRWWQEHWQARYDSAEAPADDANRSQAQVAR
jgi:glycosyltransferase involved in cell wall biosynthesis